MTSLTASKSQELESLHRFANTALNAAAALWFVVAVIGQWIFVVYIVSFYGGAVVEGDLTRLKGLAPGYIPGDNIGNFAFAMHILLAVIITACGPLQLIPKLRTRAPSFHRWNGRIYLLAAFTSSVGGLYMTWVRGTVGGAAHHVGTSLNGVLIMLCAAMALRHAVARRFAVHRRWALRLFLVVNGVWFFRVGLMFWIFVNQGPAGFDPETFQGPFLTFLSFSQSLLPLAVLEIYLRVRDRTDTQHKFAMASGLLVLTVVMGIGILAATVNMWLPHIQG